ncbi:hypothetical protein HU200_044217 [Digitaria exilis]|uniref:RING-type E3 ubiquitin transferase n=1 Tax=Digitaria exilis TaxID=1010633 RepID=A0A835B7V2_9POAL|nr:hypothetical protein HU200_044217 [Digitaria exilis]
MGLDATTAAEVAAVVTLAVLIVAIVAASAGACGGVGWWRAGAGAAAVHDVELALGSDTLVTYDQATEALKSIIRRKASSSPAKSATEEKKEPEEAEAPPCCALCLSEYAGGGGGELVRVVPACGHFFHAECGVDWWLKKRGTCPLCRGDVRPPPPPLPTPARPECPTLPARVGLLVH